MGGATASMARLGTIDPSLDVPPPPVNVAATGPRMIALAARYADGVSFASGRTLTAGPMRRGRLLACAEHGRDPAELTLGCYVQVAVCDDEGDRARACEMIRARIMTHSRFSGFDGTACPRSSGDDGRPIRRPLDAMEGVHRTTAGGTCAHLRRRARGARLLSARRGRRRLHRPLRHRPRSSGSAPGASGRSGTRGSRVSTAARAPSASTSRSATPRRIGGEGLPILVFLF